MKFDVDDKNRCRLVCVKFQLNRCRFAVAVAKYLGGSLFLGHSVYIYLFIMKIVQSTHVLYDTWKWFKTWIRHFRQIRGSRAFTTLCLAFMVLNSVWCLDSTQQSGGSQQKGAGSQFSCEVQDLLLEVVDLKQEAPDLRSGHIPPPI